MTGVQSVGVLADDDGVPCVVAAVELDDVVDGATELVGGLALALVAPLGADEHECGHDRSSRRCLWGRHRTKPRAPAPGALAREG
jgi:hypothetical protein